MRQTTRVVLGALATSRVTVKSPQLVSKVTVFVLAGSSFVVGSVAPPSGFGSGAATCAHPLASSRAVVDVVEPPLDWGSSAPQAATTVSAASRARRRIGVRITEGA